MPEKLKIAYLIGGLGAGGSERQLTELASLMKNRGHTVEISIYNNFTSPYEELLIERQIPLNKFEGRNRLHKILLIRNWLKKFQPDIVHGFMKKPSNVAILASLGIKSFAIVGSDFSGATYSKNRKLLWTSLVLFQLADAVVTQTHMNKGNIVKKAPFLKHKVHIIRNGVDTRRFQYVPKEKTIPFRFLTVANVKKIKNPIGTIEAIYKLKQFTDIPFTLTWAGSYQNANGIEPEYQKAIELIQKYHLENVIHFIGPVSNISEEYQKAHALVHTSIQEGVSNAILEAMASGLPIVASDIADNRFFVIEKKNGFICNPHLVDSIVDAMGKMLKLSEKEWKEFGKNSHLIAEEMFGMERFANEYENLYYNLLTKRGKK
ncbi:MAG: glycosyltransferase family 4 protein [bacterium]|nr:glycosyltransferase family 4 protein [bacterium]